MPRSSKKSKPANLPTKLYFNDNFHQNAKQTTWPALVVERDGRIIECNGVDLLDDAGNLVARIVYSPDKLLDSKHYSIKAWIETTLQPRPR